MRMTILYEDEYGATSKSFGPHRLLLAIVSLETGKDVWHLEKKILCSPKKGNGSLKRAIENDAKKLLNIGPIQAVFDADKICVLYDLPKKSCKTSILKTIKETIPEGVGLILLIQNVEDLIEACCKATKEPIPTKKSTPFERDMIFNRASKCPKEVIEIICQDVPSFYRLVQRVVIWINETP